MTEKKEAPVTVVKCPTCKEDVVWGEQSPFRPFCSKRCQLIDLGEWADEEKAIIVRQICQIQTVGLRICIRC